MRRFACALVLSLLATPAFAAEPVGEEKLAGLLKGRTAGAPQSCLTRLPPQDRSYTIERIGIVYEVGSTRYLTRFEGGCPELTPFTFIVSRTPTNQLCAGDIAEIVDRSTPAIPRGSCIFGAFTPYPRAR